MAKTPLIETDIFFTICLLEKNKTFVYFYSPAVFLDTPSCFTYHTPSQKHTCSVNTHSCLHDGPDNKRFCSELQSMILNCPFQWFAFLHYCDCVCPSFFSFIVVSHYLQVQHVPTQAILLTQYATQY